MLIVSTYIAADGRRHARVIGNARTVLITRDRMKPEIWSAWYSDSIGTIVRGSFRQCVAAARRRLYPRP